VCVAVRYPQRIQKMGRAMVRPVLVALPVIATLLAYPVWMLAAGPQHSTARTYPVENPYTNDLLSFFVPGPLQHVSLGMRALGDSLMSGPYATRFGPLLIGSNPDEFGGYIGVLVLVLVGVLVWRARRSSRMQLASALFLVAAVLSLGPYLIIDARSTHLPLPFLLLAHIPLVEDVLPARFSLEVIGCLAAMIAFGLDDMHNHRPRPKWLTSRIFAGALVGALVVTQLPQWPYSTKQGSTLPTALRTTFPASDPVTITFPYLTYTFPQPMEWQMDSGYAFRLLGGYAHTPNGTDPSPMSPPGLQRFLTWQGFIGNHGPPLPVGPALVSITRTTLSKYGVGMVIVYRSESGSGPVIKLFNEALGPPNFSTGQFSMWANWHK
jgi:hypothetical protein